MKTRLYFVAGKAIFQVEKSDSAWALKEIPTPHEFHCLAVNPLKQERLYAGSFDDGLWMSDNYGATWQKVGAGIEHDCVLSVTVSPTEVQNGYSVVWAGTEPSGLFRSEDGGKSWVSFPKLLELPSKSTWRFPPRPHTHHVRWIQPDIHEEHRIYVGIELGGVMKSENKGVDWEDRKPGSQHDCHTLTMNSRAPGRIYEAAGGGFAESLDAGKTWRTVNDGLAPYTYLVDIAVDPADPDTIIASAARSASEAYNPERASTVIVRREKDQPWEIVSDGLPEPNGASIFSLLAHDSEPGVFYAVNNLGIYQSGDAGKTWSRLPVDWPEHVKGKRVRGFVLLD